MTIKFNVAERKPLVEAFEAATGKKAKYLRVPSCAYLVDCFRIEKDSTVSAEEAVDEEYCKRVLNAVADAGFVPEGCPANEECTESAEPIGLTVTVPLENVNVSNLTKLLENKNTLICHALGVRELPMQIEEDCVSFPWFSELPDANSVKAYTHFISALCEMSKELKRINTAVKKVDNEKYAFRCFLLRLGFIGAEYKPERKILLRNLSGSSAFKGGANHVQ